MAETVNQKLFDEAQEAAVEAAIVAGYTVLSYWPAPGNPSYDAARGLEIIEKGQGIGNFATPADFASGDAIRATFACYPLVRDLPAKTEETVDASSHAEPWWNIDEIDGTANFSRGSEHFGISIGLHAADDTPEIGVIAFPAKQELIVARRGQGAKLLSFSGVTLTDLTEFAKDLPADPPANQLFVAYDLGYSERAAQIQTGPLLLADKISALKSYHSSSYSLGQVAMGTLDAFFSRDPTIYDIGASSVAIKEIGGEVTDMQGRPIDWNAPKRSILAARTPQIHARVLAMLRIGE